MISDVGKYALLYRCLTKKWEDIGNMRLIKEEYAVVTGASSGIGMAFAIKLASLGYNILLIARSEDKLRSLARKLSDEYNIKVGVLQADLSRTEDIARIEVAIKEYKKITALINSAGFALRKKFVEQDTDKQLSMIHLHIDASTRLAKAVLPSMIEHNNGFIINVSSLLSFMDLDNNSVHCATKAYLNRFSKNLQLEVKDKNIKVQALNAGFTMTNFHNTKEFEEVKKSYPKMFVMTPEKLIEKSMKALNSNKVIYIPGCANQLLVSFRFIFSPILRKSLKSAPQ